MNIQFVKEREKVEDDFNEVERIIIDGVKDEASSVRHKYLYIEQEKTYQKLLQLSFDELKTHLDYLIYSLNVDWCEYPLYITIALPKMAGDEHFMWVSFEVSYLEWDKPYSISDFIEVHKQFTSQTSRIKFVEVEDARDEIIGNFFYLEIIIDDVKVPVQQYVQLLMQETKDLHLASIEVLKNDFDKVGLSVLYSFPKEVRAACNQYLVYFAQFLSDLGIEADTSIRESADKTLFTVIPKDKKQALENIQKALLLYLEVPSENINLLVPASDIAHMQWKANILHLQSQIELSRAIIQAKDETIEALKIANYQLLSYLPKEEQSKSEKKSSEEILGGIATVDDVKLKGVTIKLPEIIRRLRRRFM